MVLHLQNKRGLKKYLEQLKGMSNDVQIKNYDSFISIESYKLTCYVHVDPATQWTKKQKFYICVYERINFKNSIEIPARYIDLVG